MTRNDRIRVLVANPSVDLYGADRMMLETVVALRERGHHVVVTIPSDGPLSARLSDLGVEVVTVDAPVVRRGYLSPRGITRLALSAIRSLPACRRTIRETRADVVYVNTLTFPVWILAGRWAGRPVVAHIHELEDTISAPIRAGLLAPMTLARTVIANSRATVNFLATTQPMIGRLLAGRTRLIYNGVAGPRSTRSISTPPPEPGTGTEIRLAYVGRIARAKGTDIAIEAVALMVRMGLDVRLDVHGEVFAGNESYEWEVRRLAARLGVGDRVRWRGFRPDVWPAYEAAHIVVVPSRAETFGLVAVEAQLARRPVITSDAHGLVETVEAGRTGTVVPAEDPAALAAAVRDVVADWPRATAMAERGAERAGRLFSPAAYRNAITDVVERLARAGRPFRRRTAIRPPAARRSSLHGFGFGGVRSVGDREITGRGVA